jgi:hypothetical protein
LLESPHPKNTSCIPEPVKRSQVEFRSIKNKNSFILKKTDVTDFPQDSKLRNEICESVYKKKNNNSTQKSNTHKKVCLPIEPVLRSREFSKLDNTLDS